MNTNSNHELPARLLAVAAILFSLSIDVQAADDTWSGNGATASWSDTGNWDAMPVNGDDTIFSGTTQLSSVNDITGLSLGWLWLNGSGYSITGNPITLTGGITNSFDGNTVGVNLTLGDGRHVQTLQRAGLLGQFHLHHAPDLGRQSILE
jgi:hypothetical protein